METEYKNINENYRIYNDGRVFNCKTNKELKPWKTSKGYLKVDLGRNLRKSIHRLVAENFIPNIDNKPTVNHKNHDKTDNTIENLEWATYKEQIAHDVQHGKRKIIKDEKGRFRKQIENQSQQKNPFWKDGE